MPIGTYFAIYFIVWWLCLFMVMPFSMRTQIDDGEWLQGTDRGAPSKTYRFGRALLLTTLISIVLTALLLWGLSSPWLREYWS